MESHRRATGCANWRTKDNPRYQIASTEGFHERGDTAVITEFWHIQQKGDATG
jgi:hypothetical protein